MEIGLTLPKGAAYKLNYKIEKVGDIEEISYKYINVKAEELTKAAYDAEKGKSVERLDANDDIYYDPVSGHWKVVANDAVVMVAMKKKDKEHYLPLIFNDSFENIIKETGGVSMALVKENYVIESYVDFLNEYIAIANTDGLCALTTEMKDFLDGYARQERLDSYEEVENYPADKLFYFPCFYYAE